MVENKKHLSFHTNLSQGKMIISLENKLFLKPSKSSSLINYDMINTLQAYSCEGGKSE